MSLDLQLLQKTFVMSLYLQLTTLFFFSSNQLDISNTNSTYVKLTEIIDEIIAEMSRDLKVSRILTEIC